MVISQSGITKNRGEWAEVIAIVDILANGYIKTVSLLNGQLVENNAVVKVSKVSIVRDKATVEFHILRDSNQVKIENQHSPIIFSSDELKSDLKRLKELFVEKLKNKNKRTFSIAEAEAIMEKYCLGSGKAKSSLKQDVDIALYGPDNVELPYRGFSIKSFLVSDPTIFNASRDGRFRYKIDGNKVEEAKRIEKEIEDQGKKRGWIRSLLRKLDGAGAFTYRISVPEQQFKRNLELLDSNMPEILGYMLLQSFVSQDSSFKNALARIIKGDPLEYGQDARTFYTYRVKHFLRAAALGFSAIKTWNGVEGAEGGMIMVRQDLSLRCFLSGKSDFEDYLLNSSHFDAPSTKVEKWGGYAKIEESDEGAYLEMILQVRERNPFLK